MDEVKIPDGTVFTMKVPLDRDRSKFGTFYLREMEEATFLAAKSLLDNKKHFDAVRMILSALCLPGSDSVDLLKGPSGFIGLNSASVLVAELIEPLEGELKKN